MRIDRLLRTDNVWKISLSTKDEQDISCLWLHEYRMRFGTAQLKMGGIAGVGTNEGYRNRGYSRRVMEDSTTFMTENGFDVAMLFGIPNFYPKFGYATVLPETWAELDTEEAQAAVAAYQVRKFEMRDAPKILALYAANNAERTGTPVRDETHWKGFKMGSNFGVDADPFVVLNEADEVIGYFVCDDTEENCILCDIGFQNRTIFETVVRFLGDRASRIGVAHIRCSMPADHPFAIFCRRYGCRTNIHNPKNRGCMMRIINQSSTLKGITGELEKRLRRSAHLSQWSGKILIATDLGQDCLGIDRGRVAHINSKANAFHLEIPQDKLIQLMMGRRSIADLAVDPYVSVTGGIIPVLEILFPLGYPHVWWPDRF
jgi:predicted acetyltransferase